MNNKRALSEVITTIIIILLVIVAILVVWGVVRSIIDKAAGQAEDKGLCIDASLTFVENSVTCNLSSTDKLTVKVGRGADGLKDARMKIIAGENITDIDAPPTLGEKRVTNLADPVNGTVVTVKVAPIVGPNNYLCEPTNQIQVTCLLDAP